MAESPSRALLTVDLGEWKEEVVHGVRLTPADRRMAAMLGQRGAGRLEIEELREGVRIRARSWVGVARLESLEVRVRPKLAGGEEALVGMIECTRGLDALDRVPGARRLAADGAGLLELLALILANECERLVRGGLLRGYVEREEAIPVVRGRLLAAEYLLRPRSGWGRIPCRYDEHESNVRENRVLLTALRACAARTRRTDLTRRLRAAEGAFAQACGGECARAHEWQQPFHYNRLNAHYRDALNVAELILEGFGVSDIHRSGNVRSFAFFLDMNRLFEDFTTEVIRLAVRSTEYGMYVQRTDRSVIRDARTGHPYRSIRPDILVVTPHEDGALPVDAKYKEYARGNLNEADIYQAFLYAYAYASSESERPPRALLIHPLSEGAAPEKHLSVQGRSGCSEARISAIAISLPQAVKEVRDGSPGPTAGKVRDALLALDA